MHNASSDASCTVTTSLGSAFDKKLVIGETTCWMPSVQYSDFLREDFDDDFSECLRDDVDDDEDARVLTDAPAVLLVLLPPG